MNTQNSNYIRLFTRIVSFFFLFMIVSSFNYSKANDLLINNAILRSIEVISGKFYLRVFKFDGKEKILRERLLLLHGGWEEKFDALTTVAALQDEVQYQSLLIFYSTSKQGSVTSVSVNLGKDKILHIVPTIDAIYKDLKLNETKNIKHSDARKLLKGQLTELPTDYIMKVNKVIYQTTPMDKYSELVSLESIKVENTEISKRLMRSGPNNLTISPLMLDTIIVSLQGNNLTVSEKLIRDIGLKRLYDILKQANSLNYKVSFALSSLNQQIEQITIHNIKSAINSNREKSFSRIHISHSNGIYAFQIKNGKKKKVYMADLVNILSNCDENFRFSN